MLGNNILKLRKQLGFSQEELSEKVNVTRQTISNWELNETQPNPEQLKLLSKALNVSVDDLIGNDIKNVVEEKIDGPVILDDEPTGPVVLDEEPKTRTKKKKIDIDKIDDEALKVLEDTVKVEQDTFVVLTDDEIENKESTRKIIRGKDKFKKKEIITAQLEEKPFVVFCNSCGNIVSADDVICPHCEEPIK